MIQPIDVLDTAVKIGFGALVGLIGGLSAYLLEQSKQKNEHLKERLRQRREMIIYPIVAFIDEYLGLLSETYWAYTDKVETNIAEKIVSFRNKEAMIEARVVALKNTALSRSFLELTTKLIAVRTNFEDGGIVQARGEVKKAHTLAADVLAQLFELDTIKKG